MTCRRGQKLVLAQLSVPPQGDQVVVAAAAAAAAAVEVAAARGSKATKRGHPSPLTPPLGSQGCIVGPLPLQWALLPAPVSLAPDLSPQPALQV